MLPSLVFWLLFLVVIILLIALRTYRQKTRNPQQRRAYLGSRSQTSIPASEPSIYVSPANLPPPPKYEAMAPPSYEEVVGIHYPAYQPGQPINQPITTALALQSNTTNTNTATDANSDTNNETNVSNDVTRNTTITTIDERRPVTAAS